MLKDSIEKLMQLNESQKESYRSETHEHIK